jgi:hypothetical protein
MGSFPACRLSHFRFQLNRDYSPILSGGFVRLILWVGVPPKLRRLLISLLAVIVIKARSRLEIAAM